MDIPLPLLHIQRSKIIHRRIFNAELPKDGIKCIEKLQSHCENMNFAKQSIDDRIFQQVTNKRGESQIN